MSAAPESASAVVVLALAAPESASAAEALASAESASELASPPVDSYIDAEGCVADLIDFARTAIDYSPIHRSHEIPPPEQARKLSSRERIGNMLLLHSTRVGR